MVHMGFGAYSFGAYSFGAENDIFLLICLFTLANEVVGGAYGFWCKKVYIHIPINMFLC